MDEILNRDFKQDFQGLEESESVWGLKFSKICKKFYTFSYNVNYYYVTVLCIIT